MFAGVEDEQERSVRNQADTVSDQVAARGAKVERTSEYGQHPGVVHDRCERYNDDVRTAPGAL